MRWWRQFWAWAKQRIGDLRRYHVWDLDAYRRKNPHFFVPPRDSERWIYKFWNGREVEWVDPLRCHMNLLRALDGDPAAAVPRPEDTLTDDTSRALGRVIGAVRAAFAVKPAGVDDDGAEVGLTDKQCLELLADFIGWFKATGRGWTDVLRNAAQAAREVAGE
jgi:hypothetical protein